MSDTDAAAGPAQPHGPDYISYADFGQRFFELAVTEQRVVGAVGGLAGRPIEVGPMSAGPMGLAKVRASGAVGEPVVEPEPGEHVAYRLIVPIDLQLTIEMALDRYRFTAAVLVRLSLTARAADRLLVLIEIEPPTPRNVEVDLQADGLRASVIQLVGGIEGEIKKAVARIVSKEIDSPAARAKRTIDVEAALRKLG